MKSIKIKFNVREIIARTLSFLRARFSVILLLIFFAVVAAWAFIFWYYAIGTPRARPDVEVKIISKIVRLLKKTKSFIQLRETTLI